jgi:membrane-associated protein
MSTLLDPIVLIQTLGLVGIFALVFVESGIFFGFFFPGDSLLFTAGLLSSQGYFSLALLLAGCIISAVAGGGFGYLFGRQIGPVLFSREDSLFFHQKHLERAQRFYETHGIKTIVLARFIPVVRTFAPILAGVGRMRYRTFMFFNILGALLWTLLLCLSGFYLGHLVPNIEHYLLPIIMLIIVLSFLPTVSLSTLRRRKPSSESIIEK